MLFLSLTSTHLKLFLNSILDMIYIPRTPLGNFVIVLDFHLKVFLFHCNIHGQQIRLTLNGCNGVNQQF